MTKFKTHTIESAPEDSKAILQGAESALQFVPNIFGTMAEAPALLEGYTTLAKIFDKTSFSETERQVVLMTNNILNGCSYCMSAHTTLAKKGGVPDDVINSLRAGTPLTDTKLEALRQFATVINETRGWPEQSALDAFLGAGYTQQHVLEVVLGTALKVMSNYTNHIAETDLDDAFKPTEWTKADLKDAA
jgi:AhpD family alkylhydroperoxidase